MPARNLARLLVLAIFSAAVSGVPGRAAEPLDNEPKVDPGPNIKADGLPPISASLVAAVRPFTEMRTAAFRSWHPERREMLITTRFGETDQIHRVRAPGGDRRQLTFLEEPISWASHDRVDGRSFVYSIDRGGNEFFQLYRFDTATGTSTLLTDGVKRHFGGPWSNSGELFSFVRVDADKDGAFTEVWVIDPRQVESGRKVTTLRGGGWTISDWSPDDVQILLREQISEGLSSLWLVDVTTGRQRRATPEPGASDVAWGAGRFSADGKTIFVTTDLKSEFRQLAALALDGGKLDVLTADIPWDVVTVERSRSGRKLAFVTNEAGFSRLYLLDTAKRKRRAIDALPNGVADGLRWHANENDLAITVSSARIGGDVFVVDAKSGKVERWTSSETGGLDSASFVEPTPIEWESFDGRKIPGLLYQPDAARFRGKRPVIIDIHGGPEGQARPSFRGAANYWTTERGIALLFPNVRGSLGYGKTFVDLDNGRLREGSYRDIEALLDWIGKNPHLDADRVMITGGSYGGHMTFAVATRYADRIRSAVAVIGISNLRTFLENTQAYRRDLRRVEYGDERDPEMREFLDRIAPLNHARQITKPILVIAGRNDPRAPWSESDQIVKAVRANDVPAWFLTAEDEGHGFKKKSNRSFQLYATAAFVEQYLLNE